jgi:3-methyl-2-oxobutanoate hydroxymethyltransferase
MPRPSISDLQGRAAGGAPLLMLTAYDSAFARLAESSGIDLLLVGDSVATTQLGYTSTHAVTMDAMLHHTGAVVRATRNAHVVCDLPFLSYHCGEDEAVRNAGRALQEAGAQSVKFEGGARWAPFVTRCTDAGIPIMGHLGVRPGQSSLLQGYPGQERAAAAAHRVLADALALEAAGAWALLLEKLPVELAAAITDAVRIPTIGIGSGPHCNGQVQVTHQLLDLDDSVRPPHAGRYAALASVVRDAFSRFADDVTSGAFPAAEHAASGGEALADFPHPHADGDTAA